MLSVGSRGDGRKPIVGLQFEHDDDEEGVAMEENELEEGEACSGKEEGEDDDDDASIDPDALSYIDVKLQNVLGHFQKDFEGGVCAENLGAKFGGYGSFLPTYQRSPSISYQSRSPHATTGGINGVNTTYFSSQSQVSPQNNTVAPWQQSTFFDNNTQSHTSTTPFSNNNKDAPTKPSTNQEITPQHDSFSRSSNGSDQRTFKVRIKVGPDSAPPKNNNAAIYSRLGIDMSPSSSPQDSPQDSAGGGLFTTGFHSPNTPLTTFKLYSALHAPALVPYPLSPICQGLLFMPEKKPPLQKHTTMEENVPTRSDKNHVKCRIIDDKGSKFSAIDSNFIAAAAAATHLSSAPNRMDAKTSPRKQRGPNTLSPSLPPPPKCNYDNSATQPVPDRFKDSSVSKRTDKTLLMNQRPSPDKVDKKEPAGITKFGSNASAPPSLKQNSSLDSGSDDNSVLPSGYANHAGYRDPHKIIKGNDVIKSFDIVKTESNAATNHLLFPPAESVKLRAPQKTISYEQVGDLQENHTSIGKKKKKIKGTKSSHKPSRDIDPASAPPTKEKKSNTVRTGDMDINHLNAASKPQKDPNRKVSKESTGYNPVIKVDHRSKLGDVRLDYEGASLMPGDTMKEQVLQRKPAANPLVPQPVKASEAVPVINNEIAFDVAPPSDDCWVQCDKCQKWRLCPLGVKPEDLPHIWFCHMLDWLPGMNRCSISEEETTQAVRAPYQPLIPESQVTFDYMHHATTSGITSRDPQLLNQDLAKANGQSKKPSDPGQNFLEPNQNGDCSTYFHTGKQKHKNTEKREYQEKDHYPKKGDSVEKGSKSVKLKSRKEFDQDGMRTSKKLKSAGSSDVKHDRHHNFNSSGERNSGPANDNYPELSTKYHKDDLLPNDSRRSILQLSQEMVEVPHHTTENIQVKEAYSNRSDTSKKRKVKQQHESKDHPKAEVGIDIRKETTEALLRKEKKPRASKFDIRELNGNRLTVESERNRPFSGTPLSGNRDEFHLQNSHDKQDADHAYPFSKRNVNNVDNPKRVMGFSQTSTAATSSSSKNSGSFRSKTNFQEARGSPVESVSSSPLRTSATGKLTRRVDDTRNLDMFSKGSTGEYFSDVDGAHHQKRKTPSAVRNGSLEFSKVSESRVVNPVNETSNMTGKKTGPLSESKAQNILLSIFGHTDDDHSSEYEDTNVGVGAVVTSEPSHNVSGEFQVRSHGKDLKLYDDFRPDERNSQNVFCDNSCRPKEKQRNSEVDVSDAKRKKLPVPASDQRDKNSTANNGMDAHGRPTESSRQEKYNLEKIEKKTCPTKSSGEQTKDIKKGNHSISAPGNYDVGGSSLPADKHRGSDASVAGTSVACGNSGKFKYNEKVQEATRNEGRGALGQHDRMDRSDKASAKSMKLETSLPLANKQDLRDVVPQSVSTILNEIHSVPLPEKVLTSTPVSLPKETGKSGNRNEAVSSSLMQLTPNRLDVAGSSKRDAGISVTNILKEATDLKHTANRKKNEGLDHESTGLYFQAALKFLYGASQIERFNSEITKHGDPIQLYFQTAKLCEFCAYEYERRKEMAAAALAYKCTEVAYMKVVYLKNNVAIKDRHELQNAPQIGESPSSSASDVDNLNNHGMPDKTAPTKKNIPLQGSQPAGGLVIAARNRSSFSRILSFVEATNCAMEASKKSIYSLALATSTINEESKKGVEDLFSVQRTLDFSFHDIEGLLRLVRLAMEHISRWFGSLEGN